MNWKVYNPGQEMITSQTMVGNLTIKSAVSKWLIWEFSFIFVFQCVPERIEEEEEKRNISATTSVGDS